MSIKIDSTRTGRTYDIKRFTEFDVSIDLETDSDAFDIVVGNPHGMYTGLFSKFDRCELFANGKKILVGNLDNVEYIWTGDNDYIQLSGRDLCWKLVDNDALPDTLQNVVPKTYVSNKCKTYGIKSSCVDSDIYGNLVIGCGESEISIMNNILLESRHRIWYLIDTVYTGEWSTNAKASHTFVRGNSVSGVRMERLSLSENGSDMKSEVIIYGSNDDGVQKMVGKSENKYMISKGIIKRQVRRSYSDKASSKYMAVALKDMRDNFRDNIVLTVTVALNDTYAYMPNTTVHVVDSITGIDSIFFVRKVQYKKTIDSGSEVEITMIPADTIFEKMWQSSTNTSVTNLNKLSKGMR
jgi:prophage tail gpP-like protein